MKYIRSLYDWVLSWAYKKTGHYGLALISFTESIFFPIPPDVLLIPLCIGNPKKIFKFASICTFGSILGASIGYFLGYSIWWDESRNFSLIALKFFEYIPSFNEETFESIKLLYDEYNLLIIFTAGFTPIPFKIFTISAGAFNLNFFMFIFASSISRGARFFLLAVLLKLFGESITNFIDKYFNILSLIFTITLICGFLLLKYIF